MAEKDTTMWQTEGDNGTETERMKVEEVQRYQDMDRMTSKMKHGSASECFILEC